MPPGAEARARLGPTLVVLAAVALAYANALAASFQFDDFEVIVRDPRVQSLGAWWHSLPGIRPFLKLSYALGHTSGFGVVGFHAFNVAVHAIAGLLVLELVRQRALGSGSDSGAATRISLATALLFTLHPVQTEAVTYASGRSASLCVGLALASILSWGLGRDQRRTALMVLVSPCLMLLALGVKESAVVVPGVLMLWIAADPGRPFRFLAALRETAAHWIALILALAAGLSLPAYQSFLETSLATRSPAENLVAQVHGVAYLLCQLVRVDRLNADPVLVAVTTWDASGILLAIALVGAVGLALAGLRRWPLASFGVLWTVIWLLPTNSLLARLDLVNDRQWYGALLGPALLLALSLERLARRTRAGAQLALAVLVLVGGITTHLRNDVYRDEITFWSDVIDESPHNARAFNNLGIALAEHCDLPGAERAWRRALELDSGFVRAAVNLRLRIEEQSYAQGCRPDDT